MRAGLLDRLRFALVIVVSALGTPAVAQPVDVTGWERARWGMTGEELDAAFDGSLKPLSSRLDFGALYVDRTKPSVVVGGLSFTALFQMDAATGRLGQVLLQLRRPPASRRAYGDLLAELRGRYGPPRSSCVDAGGEGGPRSAEFLWRFPTTTVRAVFFDFVTTEILLDDPNVDIHPLRPYYETRRINPRFLPRRILIRFTPAAEDAGGTAHCGAVRG